ncbi:MAG: class I SAM-dependent methyltransferase [Alphaproteobacteria bacterium]|nr:class I SAM-dependent methyltransferase [Alphaproteobacteria bacterium]
MSNERKTGVEVRDQYEAYPYLTRDPADEANRLVTGSPSHLDELNYYVFVGRRDFTRPFRALVAGCGTGDGAIMLAQQLADRGGPTEIECLDLSDASLGIATACAKARGLGNIRFRRASLFELDGLGLGHFDYIDCCGVLRHLDDPPAGLAALRRALKPGGGMGIMVYAPLGRAGVYETQHLLRLIGGRCVD